MRTFSEWTKEYNDLFKRQSLVEKELKCIQTSLIKELLEKEYREINSKIKEFEKMKLYTESEYENASRGW
jgi:hypothetical protein